MNTNRGYRLYPHDVPLDPAKTGNMRFADGQVRDGMTVNEHSLIIDFSKVYPDDSIAIIRDMYVALQKSRTDQYNEEIIGYLTKAIYAADRRAVARHGYSWSPNERDLPVPKDY